MKFEKADDIKKLMDNRKHKDRLFSESKAKAAHYAAGGIGCVRKAVYEFSGAPQLTTDLQTRMTFWFGDKGQEFIEEELKLCRIYEAREQSIAFQDKRLRYPFSMRIDVLGTVPKEIDPDQKLRPFEMKTMGASQFYNQEYKGWGGRPDTVYPGASEVPKDYHLSQLNLYLKAMNLDYGYLIVMCKDDSNYSIHKCYYDEKMYEDVVAHCKVVEDAVDAYNEHGVLPPRAIEPLPLGVYKRDTKENRIGDVKLDKSSFPCMWQNKKSGKYGMCNFFAVCHKDTMEKLGLTIDDFNKPIKPIEPAPVEVAKEIVPTITEAPDETN